MPPLLTNAIYRSRYLHIGCCRHRR